MTILPFKHDNECVYRSALNITYDRRVESVGSMKVLGFTFSSKPDCEAHIMEIGKNFNMRSWFLRNSVWIQKFGYNHNLQNLYEKSA